MSGMREHTFDGEFALTLRIKAIDEARARVTLEKLRTLDVSMNHTEEDGTRWEVGEAEMIGTATLFAIDGDVVEDPDGTAPQLPIDAMVFQFRYILDRLAVIDDENPDIDPFGDLRHELRSIDDACRAGLAAAGIDDHLAEDCVPESITPEEIQRQIEQDAHMALVESTTPWKDSRSPKWAEAFERGRALGKDWGDAHSYADSVVEAARLIKQKDNQS